MAQLIKLMRHNGNKYGVFLSFSRGEDAQESFSSHLYLSLRKAEISVLKDDISIELLRSIIEGSKISIIIFSQHYAGSKRCLEELTKIMEFRRAYDQVVLPIFYGVNRSDVRNQESSFGKAFRDLIRRISPTEDEVLRWRAALREAGGNYGFVVSDYIFNEEMHVQNIVKHVLHILDRKGLLDSDGLIGVSSQVKEVIRMLQKHKSKDVISIGIWGMGVLAKQLLPNSFLTTFSTNSSVHVFYPMSGRLGRGKADFIYKENFVQ